MPPRKASNKRKRKSTLSTPKKRARHQSTSSVHTEDAQEPEEATDEYWPAEKILAESARKYLIKWEDNPRTGETYSPTWEWKSFANAELIQDFENSKAEREAAGVRLGARQARDAAATTPSPPPADHSQSLISASASTKRRREPPSSSEVSSFSSSPSTPLFVENSQSSRGSASYQPTREPSNIPSAPDSSVSNSYIPTTQEVSGSDQDSTVFRQPSGSYQDHSTTQETAGSGLPESSRAVSEDDATSGRDSPLFEPEEETDLEGSSPLQPVIESHSQGIEVPDSQYQEEHEDTLEIPESPLLEEPNSFPKQQFTAALPLGSVERQEESPEHRLVEKPIGPIENVTDLPIEESESLEQPSELPIGEPVQAPNRFAEQGPKAPNSLDQLSVETSAELGVILKETAEQPHSLEQPHSPEQGRSPEQLWTEHSEDTEQILGQPSPSDQELFGEPSEPVEDTLAKSVSGPDPSEQSPVVGKAVEPSRSAEGQTLKETESSEELRAETTEQLEAATVTGQTTGDHIVFAGTAAKPSSAAEGRLHSEIQELPAKAITPGVLTKSTVDIQAQKSESITVLNSSGQGSLETGLQQNQHPESTSADVHRNDNTSCSDSGQTSQRSEVPLSGKGARRSEPPERGGAQQELEALKSQPETQITLSEQLTTQSSLLERSSGEQEQNAQVVHPSPYFSTQDQDHTVEDIFLTIEVSQPPESDVRHDSSQESDGEKEISLIHSDLSPPPYPPSRSLEALDSAAPPRPPSPEDTSSLSLNSVKMADRPEPDDDYIKSSFDAMFAHLRPLGKSKKKSDLQTQTGSPSGTRSPSTIPDRSPERPEPPSLRTTALVNTAATHIPEVPSLMPAQTASEGPVNTESFAVEEPAALPQASFRMTVDEHPAVQQQVHAHVDDVTIAEESDSQGSASVIDDDISLLPDEYIVPLAMEGRQKALYNDEIRRRQDVLRAFVADPQGFEQVEEVQAVFNTLKSVETHVDLLYAESSSQLVGASTQAQWDCDSCTKFRFLGELLRLLRLHELNVILVLREDNERLFEMVEKFLQGQYINYKYPAKGRVADPLEVDGSLMVTLLSADSSFIVRPPDLIVCLDGADTARVRGKNWAVNPDRVVPILQLVVPRSVSHIELCVPAKHTGNRDRLHAVVACLSQLGSDTGRPLVDTPPPKEAAEMVAAWLLEREVGQSSWPLPSIHSVKDVIDYSSQLSQESTSSASSAHPAVSSKRPLEEDADTSDPAKRMRMQMSSQANVAISRVSDSQPGTQAPATEVSRLRDQLAEMQRALAKADARDKHQRELEAAWDHQQTNHENLSKEHRVLKSELESKQKSLDAANRVKENMEQRNIKLLAELSELRAQLSEQKRVNLLSDDEKIVELTQLRQQLQEERAAKENALKAQKSTESSMEYMKDNLRQAQDSASNWKMQHDIGQEEITRLQKIASGELTTTKKVHYNSGYEALMQQYKQERVQKEHYRRLAEKRDEEMVKLKEKEKKAYGTRQSSVPRSPRVGPAGASSRAGSPLPARDRVSNLRNG